MTKKQKKEHILTNLSFNHCIVSDAIEEVCSREEFDQFLDSDKEFRDKVNQLEDARNDKVRQVPNGFNHEPAILNKSPNT